MTPKPLSSIYFCMKKLALILFISGVSSITVFAQSILDTPVKISCKSCRLNELLKDFETNHNIHFFVRKDWITTMKPEYHEDAMTLRVFMERIKKEFNIDYIIRDPNYIVFLRPEEKFNIPQSVAEVVIGESAAQADQLVELKGKITQAETNEAIPGATLYIKELKRGITTDKNGNYTLSVYPGTYRITYGAANLVPMEFDLNIQNNGVFDLALSQNITILSEVTILDKRERDLLNVNKMGITNLTAEELKRIPAPMGEADVFKGIMALPGVSSVGEGSGGLNVRGGMAGQNLILMDGIPIYNASHLAGFFSIFNPDVVRDVTLYRGGVPSNFGGRSSAFLDVKLNDGNNQKIKGNGGAGIMASRFSIEGPISRNKSSFVLGTRVAYPNLLMHQLRKAILKTSSAFFYDLNGKVKQEFNDGSKLSLSLYSSFDEVDFIRQTLYSFGNNAGRLEWDKMLNQNTHLYLFASNSRYSYTVEETDQDEKSSLKSYINDARLNAEISFYKIENHTLSAGLQNVLYSINSGKYTSGEGPDAISEQLPKDYGLESAIYVRDEFTISPKLSVDYGIRYPLFFKIGPGTEDIYAEGIPKSPGSITGTKEYKSGEIMQSYHGLEPRVSVLYKLSDNISLKAGYNRINQFIHLITNTTAVTPIDLWRLSNRYIKPNFSDQVSVGYFSTLTKPQLEISVELYYKLLHNSIDYTDGASLYRNDNIEADILQGKGKAYGGEILIKRSEGRVQGWVAYTYSRSFIQVDGTFAQEKINEGRYYPTNFDRPHDLKIFMDVKLTNRFSVVGNFTYATGRPITYPESYYEVGGITVPNYSDRNKYRIPDSHHLDLSLTMSTSLKKKKRVKASWTLSVYNIYGRKNPYSVYFKNNGLGMPTAYQLSVFGNAFPSVTYNFTF